MADAPKSGATSTMTWKSSRTLDLPETDIVSVAFENFSEHNGDKPIFVDAQEPSRFLTTTTCRSLVLKLRAGWDHIGLSKGECVTICTPNHILYPPIWLSVIGAGGVVAGVNPALTVPELEHHLTITASKYIVVHNYYKSNIINAAASCSIAPEYILVFNDEITNNDGVRAEASTLNTPTSYGYLKALLQYGEQSWTKFDESKGCMSTPALHATTSGTTGLPKAAVLPHQYVVSQSLMLEDQYKSRGENVSLLICLPIFHAFAGNLAIVLPLRLGITTYYLPRFNCNDLIDSISRFGITDAPVVPPIVAELVQHGQYLSEKLESLRCLICAGAAMNVKLQDSLSQHLHKECRIPQCWGTTETGWVTLTPTNEIDRSGSVGCLLANTKLKIVASNGRNVTDEGECGEAHISTSSMLLGYRNNSTANAQLFDDEGFYKTGDLACFRNGKIFIQGRIKDVLKVKGWQVSPQELEETIQAHPKVRDCAVVGVKVKDSAGLEDNRPKAYVVLEKDVYADDDDICAWVSARKVAYKHLTGGVSFVDSIPRNSLGKVLRWKLLETA